MRVLLVILCMYLSTPVLFAQVNTDTRARGLIHEGFIQWVAQYPDEGTRKNRNIFQKAGDLVLGKKTDPVVKPVCSMAENKDNMWILSQGNGQVLKVENRRIRAATGKRKNDIQSYPSLVDLCALAGGEILFTDSQLNQVFMISEGGQEIRKFNIGKELEQPTGLAYSKEQGHVWIIETAAHRISVYNTEGDFLKSIGSRGSGPGEFNFPTHIWIDKDGIAYVVDAMNFRVQMFDKEGRYLSSFGKQGDATGCLARPKGIATDSDGNIYVADALFNSIQVFNARGELLYYFGGKGPGKSEFWMPAGIHIDQQDYIYVTDSYNNRIQIFQRTGKP